MAAPTNPVKSGKNVIFAVEMTTGTFTPVLSARENGFDMSANEIDTSCKADGVFGSSIAGTISITSNLSGPYRDTAEDKYLRSVFLAQTPIHGKYVTSNGDIYQGYWSVLSYNVSGSASGAEEFSIQLKNAGAITYTPFPVTP